MYDTTPLLRKCPSGASALFFLRQTLPLMATRPASVFSSSLVPRFLILFCALRDTCFSQQLYWKEINIICLHSALFVCTALIISVFWRVYKRVKCLHSSALVYTHLHSSALVCSHLHSSARNGSQILRGRRRFL